jgi:hypothetical protein
MAVLADFLRTGTDSELGAFLAGQVFGEAAIDVVEPDGDDVSGYAAFLERYAAGLAIERVAIEVVD